MHVFQVGAGSGGIVVLDLLARDPRVTRVTLADPDVYAPHNVYRHLFPPVAVGRAKAELAKEWVRAIRPDLHFDTLLADITHLARRDELAGIAAACDVGVCAVDNEPAKFAFDALMRAAGKPWTLGEVLSGGIGGWVHRFETGSACYGCVASHLQRNVTEQPAGPPPDYSDPHAARREATVPASKASIAVIASLHATVALSQLTAHDGAERPEFTSLLFSLRAVPDVFETAFRTHRFHIPRSPACLTCGTAPPTPNGDALDAAVDDALARLGAR